MATKPKPNPFRVSNSDIVGRLKLPKISADQHRRDLKDEMRAKHTTQNKPGRVPASEQKTKGFTQMIASRIAGGTPAEKSAYAKKQSDQAARRLMTKPAKGGK